MEKNYKDEVTKMQKTQVMEDELRSVFTPMDFWTVPTKTLRDWRDVNNNSLTHYLRSFGVKTNNGLKSSRELYLKLGIHLYQDHKKLKSLLTLVVCPEQYLREQITWDTIWRKEWTDKFGLFTFEEVESGGFTCDNQEAAHSLYIKRKAMVELPLYEKILSEFVSEERFSQIEVIANNHASTLNRVLSTDKAAILEDTYSGALMGLVRLQQYKDLPAYIKVGLKLFPDHPNVDELVKQGRDFLEKRAELLAIEEKEKELKKSLVKVAKIKDELLADEPTVHHLTNKKLAELFVVAMKKYSGHVDYKIVNAIETSKINIAQLYNQEKTLDNFKAKYVGTGAKVLLSSILKFKGDLNQLTIRDAEGEVKSLKKMTKKVWNVESDIS